MTLVFYDCTTAPSPRRARIILAEKNVPHTVVNIDLAKGEQMGKAFRSINPNCTVPALKLKDGTVLTDNAGIAAYLEATFPDPPLMGTTPKEKANIASWVSNIEQNFMMGMAHALRNSNPAMKDRALPGPENYQQIPALAERGLAQVDHFLKAFEKTMADRDFIASNSLSIADIAAACTIDFCKVIGKPITNAMPNIKRWRNGLAKRPSFNC